MSLGLTSIYLSIHPFIHAYQSPSQLPREKRAEFRSEVCFRAELNRGARKGWNEVQMIRSPDSPSLRSQIPTQVVPYPRFRLRRPDLPGRARHPIMSMATMSSPMRAPTRRSPLGLISLVPATLTKPDVPLVDRGGFVAAEGAQRPGGVVGASGWRRRRRTQRRWRRRRRQRERRPVHLGPAGGAESYRVRACRAGFVSAHRAGGPGRVRVLVRAG